MVLVIVLLVLVTVAGGGIALRVGRAFLEWAAERAENARDAAAAVDDRHWRHPWRYISVQSTRLLVTTHPLELLRGQLDAQRTRVQSAIDAEPRGPSLIRKLLDFACLALIPLLMLLSCYQLIPSFYTLTGNAPLSVFGGAVVAAVEVLIAFLVARVLFRGPGQPPQDEEAGDAAIGPRQAAASLPGAGAGQPRRHGGRSVARRILDLADSRPGSSKDLLITGMAIAAAALLVWGQFQWAPLHDVIGIGSELTVATDRYALDEMNSPDQTGLLTSDEQAIDTINTRLRDARARDEALAVIVPIGEDAAALFALGALGYAAEDLRRLNRRRRKTSLNRRINAIDRRIARARDAMTLETGRRLEELGHDPRLATMDLPPVVLPHPGPQVVPGQVVTDDPAQPPAAQVPGAPPVRVGRTVDDLFPPTAADAVPQDGQPGPATNSDMAAPGIADAAEDRRWTDPF